jgi:hypothetical protein
MLILQFDLSMRSKFFVWSSRSGILPSLDHGELEA